MARCGCSEYCPCALTDGPNTTVEGTGTNSDPWRITADVPFKTCGNVLDCVGEHVGPGLVYDGVDQVISVAYSTQIGNQAGPGPDGGIFVPPPPSLVFDTCESVMECVGGKLDHGLAYDELTHTLAVRYSTDAGNTAAAGTDGGVYVPPADCLGVMDCVGGRIGSGLDYNTSAHILAVRYSTDAGNIAGDGSDGGIFVPPPGEPGSTSIVTTDTPSVDLGGDGTAANPLTATVVPGVVPIAVGSTATVALSGDGTAGNPLTANTPADGLPIAVASTATVALTGNGTAGSPLTANTPADGLPIAVADSTEIDFSGNGTVSSPLTGVLKGTVTGNWLVPNGSVTIGSATASPVNGVIVQGLVAGNVYAAKLLISSDQVPVLLQATKNGTEISRLIMTEEAELSTRFNNIWRPVPWAMHVNSFSVTLGVNPVVVGYTFPTGRFTRTPMVVGNAQTSAWFAGISGVSTGGASILLRHYDSATGTGSIWVDTWAIQMNNASAPGLREPQAAPPGFGYFTVTCHTDPQVCENSGHPIELLLYAEEGTPVVMCGVCAQPITDVVPVPEARGGRRRI